MKKFLSVLLVAVMVLSLSVTALADPEAGNEEDELALTGEETLTAVVDDTTTADVTENTATFDVNVPVEVEEAYSTKATYNVKIEWEITPEPDTETNDTTVTLNFVKYYTWDPDNLKYEKDEKETLTGCYKAAAVKITITNNSNLDVDYQVEFDGETNVTQGLTVAEAKETNVKDKDTIATVDTETKNATGDTNGTLVLSNEPTDPTTTRTAKSATYGAEITIDTKDYASGHGESDFDLDSETVCLGTYTVTIGAANTLNTTSGTGE